jgi:hypothetical protein
MGAFAEAEQAHVAELLALHRLDATADVRQRDLGAGDGQLPHLAALGVADADLDLRPFRPLDLLRRFGAALAGDRFAFDRDDRVAGFDPRRIGGRTLEDFGHPQPLLHPDHRKSDPREAPFDLLVEAFELFLREVFGVAVLLVALAQLPDHPLQRGVAELLRADGAVVVAFDRFGGFGDQAARFVDEDFAQRFRQVARVPAQVEAGGEKDHQGDRDGHRPASAHAALRP